ncbi:hypothetical protein LJC58_06850 [Lachnospiraceae bacterium OttesenSCG-928-D06]|nr:hypothetical protein [Lachnospiraceae bacterium OttesenSCG-928-D06]
MTTFLWVMLIGIGLGFLFFIICLALKKKIGVLLSLLAVLMCGMFFIIDISVEPVKDIPKYIESAEEIDYVEIYNELERNEVSAKDLYNDNKYRVTATIDSISTGGLFDPKGGATITMKVDSEESIYFIAEFGNHQPEALKEISTGDTITFAGTYKDRNFYDCYLEVDE